MKRTASAWIVRGGRVLLERRSADARIAPGAWDTPGGHIEAGETPAEALARELEEELGIRPLCFELLAVQQERLRVRGARRAVRYEHHVYEVTRWSGRARAREGQQLCWKSLAGLARLAHLHPLSAALRELVRTRARARARARRR